MSAAGESGRDLRLLPREAPKHFNPRSGPFHLNNNNQRGGRRNQLAIQFTPAVAANASPTVGRKRQIESLG